MHPCLEYCMVVVKSGEMFMHFFYLNAEQEMYMPGVEMLDQR